MSDFTHSDLESSIAGLVGEVIDQLRADVTDERLREILSEEDEDEGEGEDKDWGSAMYGVRSELDLKNKDEMIEELVGDSPLMIYTYKSRRVIEIAYEGSIRDLEDAIDEAKSMCDELRSCMELSGKKEHIVDEVNKMFSYCLLKCVVAKRVDEWLDNLEEHINFEDFTWKSKILY